MWLITITFLLLAAVWCDVKTHRIPNELTLFGLAMGVASSLLPSGIGWHESALGSLLGLAVFLPLYLLRILGAGDVKLLVAVGSFIGYPDILSVVMFTVIAGSILALFLAIHHRQLYQILEHVRQGLLGFVMQIASGGRPRQWVMVVGPNRLPYALAIALGTLGHFYLNN